jgi:hypothetical protein
VQLAPPLAPPLARGASGFGLWDVPEMLDMVLPHFTLQEAGLLLAGTCRKLAEIVRDDTRTWKRNAFARKLECSPDQCYPCDVYGALRDAYAFYRQEAVSPYADWLVRAVCGQDSSACVCWEVFRGCILIETRQDEEGKDEMWILQPNTRRQIIAANMEELNRVIEACSAKTWCLLAGVEAPAHVVRSRQISF